MFKAVWIMLKSCKLNDIQGEENSNRLKKNHIKKCVFVAVTNSSTIISPHLM